MDLEENEVPNLVGLGIFLKELIYILYLKLLYFFYKKKFSKN
jgi:hypothetical protein